MTRRVWLLSKLEAGFNPRRVFWKGPRENHWTDKGERAVQFVREEDAEMVGQLLDIPAAAPVWWESIANDAAVPGAVTWVDPMWSQPRFPSTPPLAPPFQTERERLRYADVRLAPHQSQPEAEEGESD